MRTVDEFMSTNDWLPEPLKDFHDQKNSFKCIHYNYEVSEAGPMCPAPEWPNGHSYAMDWFLWYMARRGYTLQKCRAKVEWSEFEDIRNLTKRVK